MCEMSWKWRKLTCKRLPKWIRKLTPEEAWCISEWVISDSKRNRLMVKQRLQQMKSEYCKGTEERSRNTGKSRPTGCESLVRQSSLYNCEHWRDLKTGDMTGSRSSDNSTSKTVMDELKMIYLRIWQIVAQ